MTSGKTSSAKAAGLGLLLLIMALSAGCLQSPFCGPEGNNWSYSVPWPFESCNQQLPSYWDRTPEIGTLLDTNEIVKFSEKWREQNTDGTYSYHARLSPVGRDVLVNSSIYNSLPLNVTGVGYERPWGLFRDEIIFGFYPVNVTPYQDIKNRVVVVP